jgi:hypothetical protein
MEADVVRLRDATFMRLRRFDRYCVNFDPPRTSEQPGALALPRTVTTLST